MMSVTQGVNDEWFKG